MNEKKLMDRLMVLLENATEEQLRLAYIVVAQIIERRNKK